jgi:ATP-dependent Clp protease ATP-binding subunit ClpC
LRPERFTEQAQEVLSASQELVRRYHHNQWDVEHVLLALLEQEKGVTQEILRELRVDVGALNRKVEATLGRFPKVAYEAGQIYATPRISQLLESANHEADRLKDEFVSTEHLFIAIAGETRGEAAAILSGFGVDQEKIYQALQKIRGGHRVTDRQAH